MQTNWITVYDFGNNTLRIGWMLIPVSFILIGYGTSIYNIFFNEVNYAKRKKNIHFGLLLGTFALFFAIMTIPANFSSYHETKKIYESGKYEIVEGIVENFKSMPYGGHQQESFTMNNIKFSYSDYDQSNYGFNNTKSHGGPIDENKKVRLSYFISHNKNIILKIEVPE